MLVIRVFQNTESNRDQFLFRMSEMGSVGSKGLNIPHCCEFVINLRICLCTMASEIDRSGTQSMFMKLYNTFVAFIVKCLTDHSFKNESKLNVTMTTKQKTCCNHFTEVFVVGVY